MTVVRRIYSIYCISVFIGLFTALLPFFLVFIQRPSWRKSAVWLNHIWARGFFALCMVPVRVEYKAPLSKKKPYIFCANHFSYIDIPTMGLTPVPFVFVGKNSMSRVPVFGYMYRKLHILVDRNNLRSKYETLQRSIETLEQGLSLTIFPEGGIVSKNPPTMANFKSGAFKAAVEKNVPIVPVTLCHNWLFLPDDDKFLPNHRSLKVVFHEPIETKDYSVDSISELNSRVFNIIAAELERSNAYESNQGDLKEDSLSSSFGS